MALFWPYFLPTGNPEEPTFFQQVHVEFDVLFYLGIPFPGEQFLKFGNVYC